MKSLLLCTTISLFLAVTAFSQTIYLNGRQYGKIGGQWYQVDNGYKYQVDNSIITVKFKEGISQSQITSINQKQGVKIVRVNILGFYDLQIPAGSDPLVLTQNYLNSVLVEVAEPNTFGEYFGEPNDPLFDPEQWFHKHPQDHDIDTPEAWDWETGDQTVIIGVLDSGTDILHEDLEGNIWVNTGEDVDGDSVVWDADDMNGVDDDNNGYVDDLVGWDFYNNNNDVVGPYFHGTHVAGIAGAVTNNTKGVAGVAGGWYPASGIKMLIGGVGDYNPSGAILDDAILFAAQEGAHVITMSLTVAPSSAIDSAIATAYNTYGSFIDCASGNNYSSTVAYPARAKYVFAVGATNQSDQRPSFSNYGDSLDVVAPGVDIWSTRKNNSYGVGSGTSYAAPQVAGIAALLKSYNLSYSNTDIEMIIASSAEKVGGYQYDQTRKYGAWDDEMGYGRVNAFYAVAPPAAPQNLVIVNAGSNGQHPVLQWDDNTEPDLDHYAIYRGYNDLETGEIIWNSVATTTNTTWVDNDVTINTSSQTIFRYKITAVDDVSNESDYSNTVFTNGYFVPKITTEPVAETKLPQPKAIALQQNYPNPFNPATEIRFELPDAAHVSLKIYNLLGEEIRTLVNGSTAAGFHVIRWDGKAGQGKEVPSGVYLYRLAVNSPHKGVSHFTQIKKMTLLR